MSNSPHGALAGVRIVECAQDIAGPYAAMLLAEQGAEVIKVEPPGGDRARALPGFHVWNRSKRNVVADLATAAGRERLCSLCGEADVFVSDWFPRDSTLAYETLVAANPRLVHCWMPPYGGRSAADAAPPNDDLVAARSGLYASQWGYRDGPVFLTIPVVSYGTAMLAAGAVCAALLAREQSGRGQQVEVSWLAGALAMQTGGLIDHPALQRVMAMVRDPLGPIPVYRLFKASDDWFFIACGSPTFWNKLCLALERPEMVSDPRFDGAPWAVPPAHWPELKALVQSIIATRPRADWLQRLTELDIPCAPVSTRWAFIDDPQVRHLGMRREIDDPTLGRTIQMGVPVTLHDNPGAIQGPAPRFEEATGDVWPVTDTDEHKDVLREPQHERFQNPSNKGFSARPEALEGRLFRSLRRTSVREDEEKSDRQHGPLAGTLVLDFTNYIAGPFAGMTLALAGADVIKIETTQGDPFRVFGFGFYGWNQGKRGLALDFSNPAAREVVYDLVRRADVLVENLRPGATRRLGIDYETVSRLNPRLVYGSLTSFGSTGPRGHEAGFDPLLQARSGLMSAQGGYGCDPVYLQCAVCDYGAGLLCAFGAMAALLARRHSGRGQLVEVSLAQAAMAGQSGEFIFYDGRPDLENGAPDLIGRHPVRRAYRCLDGWIFVSGGVVSGAQPALSSSKGGSCSVFGIEIRIPEAFAEPADGPTAEALAERFTIRSRAEVLAACAAAGIPAGPLLNAGDLFQDPLVIANDLIYDTTAEPWGAFRQTGTLVKYGATPVAIQRPAARLGEHTDEILREVLGYPDTRIDTLRAAGVIMSQRI